MAFAPVSLAISRSTVKRRMVKRVPDLNFQIESVTGVPYAAVPLVSFRLRVSNSNGGELIHSVLLRAQIQIEVTRREKGHDRPPLLPSPHALQRRAP